MKITRFEEIEGWQLARRLANFVYDATQVGAFSRDHGLRDQIQRAAGSSMHNIAEGFDGGSNLEFVRFLRYAQRSCSEVQSQLYLALDREYINQADFDSIYELATAARSKIGGFIKYLSSGSS
jgi:four helix bundle protein